MLLTHGHIDHIWSAQKVADTFGCPVFIHPEDRFMLKDPIRGFGPRIGQIALGSLFREPKQVIDLDSDGQVLDLAGFGVVVDHTPGHTRGSVVFRVPATAAEAAVAAKKEAAASAAAASEAKIAAAERVVAETAKNGAMAAELAALKAVKDEAKPPAL